EHPAAFGHTRSWGTATATRNRKSSSSRALGVIPVTRPRHQRDSAVRSASSSVTDVGIKAPHHLRAIKGNNMPDTITIVDDRTGKQITVPITDNVFPASAVRELDPSLFIYDPAFMQTAACKSAI